MKSHLWGHVLSQEWREGNRRDESCNDERIKEAIPLEESRHPFVFPVEQNDPFVKVNERGAQNSAGGAHRGIHEQLSQIKREIHAKVGAEHSRYRIWNVLFIFFLIL